MKIIRQAEYETLRAHLAARSVALDVELMKRVGAIIGDVRAGGDRALIEYAARFDNVELTPSELRIDVDRLRRFAEKVDERVVQSLREAIRNVRAFHERQIEESWIMNAVAGVGLGERIVVAPPPRTLAETPAVAAALLELNVREVYAVGGAQAIAALAFGTETVPRVDKITGPGNKYVAAAKKLVFGVVGIDAIAGPTEVVIVTDETASAEFIAADLLAQAEHGEDASSILITTSESLAATVAEELERQLATLPRREIATASLKEYGAIILVQNLERACGMVDELAPEHVEIVTRDDDSVAAKINHAGAIFFGPYTPEAVGDYLAGPNHVLPTGRTARFSSALGVYDFVKRTSLLRYSEAAFSAVADSVAVLAEAEGLGGHARSASMRKESLPQRRKDAKSI